MNDPSASPNHTVRPSDAHQPARDHGAALGDRRREPLHIVHTEASAGWGGQELRILREAQGLMRRGHQVTLLCPHHAQIHAAAADWGVPVVALPMDRRNLSGVRAVSRWLRGQQVDVINTHSSTDTWLMALARLWHRRIPLVRTRHISAPVNKDPLTRWLYTRATNHIVTTGEQLRRTLIENNGFPGEHITSVPTGMDPDFFSPGDRTAARQSLGLPQQTPLVGIVATLRSWKGHAYLLEALARLPDPEVRLAIVGDGPNEPNIHAKMTELGLDKRVFIPGRQSDVRTWLHAMDVFALPSYANEGVPQALIQAMLCAKPVVTTPVGSILEAVQSEQNGLVVPARDSLALSEALGRLLGDPAMRDRLGANARRTAVQRFSLQVMLDNMERVFYSVVRETRPTSP